MDKVVGVLGGMGPQATVDFFQKVINLTPASGDQDHIHLIIDNNPKTPDRTGYILGKGESPLKILISRAIKLQMMGADFLVMPCNTAHYFYDEIVKYIDIPFINMIEEVALEVKSKYGSGAKAGLLATLGTYQGGIYEKTLKRYGIEMIVPDESGKGNILDVIYQIKENLNNVDTKCINNVIEKMKDENVSTIILGCTELPLIKNHLPSDIEYIASTDILARKAVERAKGDFTVSC